VRTARAYERFCDRHPRYREANDALAAHAELGAGQRVLDVAAGTGRTAEAVLPHIGERGSVLCVEPARAMRDVGARRLGDPRVSWTSELPDALAEFDRVVCSAGIWQMLPLQSALGRLAALLAPGGALVFNIPAQYVLEPDQPGGGRDPLLLELLALVRRTVPPRPSDDARVDTTAALPRSSAEVDQLLTALGLRAERWSFALRLTQAAYRDWLKLPPVSEGVFAGLAPAERERRLDDAYRRADGRSWRWERWLGWTAWRAS
jgi:SAM-dependent methyltransferase